MPVFRKDGRNILFIHVPKTGGSTIEEVFNSSGYQVMYLDGKMGPTSPNYFRKCAPQHMNAEMLEHAFRLDKFDLTFLVARDPLARFKSRYVWSHRKQASINPEISEEWVEKQFREFSTNKFVGGNHVRPQVDFLTPGCDVYNFETGLQNIVDDLDKRFDFSLNREIPRVREGGAVSHMSSKDVVVSPGLERRIKEFYAEDYIRFGYDR
ncbi:sulfotransferase family protein [Arthrobacter pigmenti]